MKSIINFYLLLTTLLLTLFIYAPVLAEEQKKEAPEEAVPSLKITEEKVNLPLKSTLILALKNNLDIKFTSLNPKASETDILREQGAFDTTFTSQLIKRQERKQTGFFLMGAGDTTNFQNTSDLETGLQKKFTAGTLAELKLINTKSETDNDFAGLDPEYSGEVELSLTQPLLKDFGISIGESQIRIAKLNFESSENEFKQNVMDILYQVEAHYWDLMFRIEDLISKRKSLQSAEDLEREFKIKIEAGALAPIEIYQAKAEVALRKQDVIVAESLVKRSEDELKAGLNLYEDETYWNVSLIPTDKPEIVIIDDNLPEIIATALEKRPDFKQAKLNLKASNIEVKYTKNQTLPRIDFVGSVGTTGLAGRPQASSPFGGPSLEPSPWDGHWDDVYDSMADGDYYKYSVGVKIEFPLENRLAKSQYNRAKIQKMQSITNIKNTENIIINEVRDAVRKLNTTKKVIDSAVASLRLSKEKLNAEEKKYDVGMSTTHDVLEFQDDLADAESTLAFAQTEHQKAAANLARTKGVLLEEKGLSL
jgi:outer membrane protein TolC